jgi:MFS family permease
VLYFFAFLDRVNVGFAALTMNADLGISSAAFGLGAGIFFIGYTAFEIPSNVLLERFGARIWIARIMLSWGVLSASMAFVQGPTSFYAVRFLLGVAEAGFFPGIIYYLTCWFPSRDRARIIALFMIALPLSSVIGAPISTALLGIQSGGLHGWQWMFLFEAIPTILLVSPCCAPAGSTPRCLVADQGREGVARSASSRAKRSRMELTRTACARRCLHAASMALRPGVLLCARRAVRLQLLVAADHRFARQAHEPAGRRGYDDPYGLACVALVLWVDIRMRAASERGTSLCRPRSRRLRLRRAAGSRIRSRHSGGL